MVIARGPGPRRGGVPPVRTPGDASFALQRGARDSARTERRCRFDALAGVRSVPRRRRIGGGSVSGRGDGRLPGASPAARWPRHSSVATRRRGAKPSATPRRRVSPGRSGPRGGKHRSSSSRALPSAVSPRALRPRPARGCPAPAALSITRVIFRLNRDVTRRGARPRLLVPGRARAAYARCWSRFTSADSFSSLPRRPPALAAPREQLTHLVGDRRIRSCGRYRHPLRRGDRALRRTTRWLQLRARAVARAHACWCSRWWRVCGAATARARGLAAASSRHHRCNPTRSSFPPSSPPLGAASSSPHCPYLLVPTGSRRWCALSLAPSPARSLLEAAAVCRWVGGRSPVRAGCVAASRRKVAAGALLRPVAVYLGWRLWVFGVVLGATTHHTRCWLPPRRSRATWRCPIHAVSRTSTAPRAAPEAGGGLPLSPRRRVVVQTASAGLSWVGDVLGLAGHRPGAFGLEADGAR